MKAIRRYAEPVAQAVNIHGPVAGVLAVIEDLLGKAGKTHDAKDARRLLADSIELVGWLKTEVGRTARGGAR